MDRHIYREACPRWVIHPAGAAEPTEYHPVATPEVSVSLLAPIPQPAPHDLTEPDAARAALTSLPTGPHAAPETRTPGRARTHLRAVPPLAPAPSPSRTLHPAPQPAPRTGPNSTPQRDDTSVGTAGAASPAAAFTADPGVGVRPRPVRVTRLEVDRLNSNNPDPEPVLVNLGVCVQEALAGARDIEHLARWISLPQYERLLARIRERRRALHAIRARPKRPLVQIRAVRYQVVREDAVEGVVITQIGAIAHILAIRLELVRGRWRAEHITAM